MKNSNETEPSITFAQVEAEVRRLAAEQPQYVYPTYYARPNTDDRKVRACYYNTPAKAHCIFGKALLNLGVNPLFLRTQEQQGIDSVLEILLLASEQEIDWAAEVQKAQDAGKPWASAIRIADQWVTQRTAEGYYELFPEDEDDG